MASETKLKTSARLLFPEPFWPTTNRGLSKVSAAEGKLRNRLMMSLVMGDDFMIVVRLRIERFPLYVFSRHTPANREERV